MIEENGIIIIGGDNGCTDVEFVNLSTEQSQIMSPNYFARAKSGIFYDEHESRVYVADGHQTNNQRYGYDKRIWKNVDELDVNTNKCLFNIPQLTYDHDHYPQIWKDINSNNVLYVSL